MIIVKTTQSMPAAAWEQVLGDALHCHIYRMFFLFVFDRYQIRHCRTVAIQQPFLVANPAMVPAVAIQQQSPVVATPATTPAAAIQQRPPAAANPATIPAEAIQQQSPAVANPATITKTNVHSLNEYV